MHELHEAILYGLLYLSIAHLMHTSKYTNAKHSVL